MKVNHVINRLTDYCHGREDQQDAVGAVARFLKSHGAHAPAAGKPSRWASVDDLKTASGFHGPAVTREEIDEAVAAALEGTNLAEDPGLGLPISSLHP